MKTTETKKFVTVKQTAARYGDCSTMTIERLILNDPEFPKPIRRGLKGRVRLIPLDELEAYEKKLVVNRGPRAA